MANENNNYSAGFLSICGLLTIILSFLKLIGEITWSWIWVLSPLWIGFIIATIMLIIMLILILRK